MKRKSWKDYESACKSKGWPAVSEEQYAGLSESEYKSLSKNLGWGDEMPPEDEEGGGEGGPYEGEDDETEKSLRTTVDEEELLKSMEFLIAAADDSQFAQSDRRRADLADKAKTGALSKSEREELTRLINGEDECDSFQKSLRDDPGMAEAIDASEFLATFGDMLADRQESLEKSVSMQHNEQALFNRRMASGLHSLANSLVRNQDKLRKSLESLTESVDRLAGQPLPYRGVSRLRGDQIQKSLRDGMPLADLKKAGNLSKAQAKRALGALLEKADVAGDEDNLKIYGDVLARMDVSPSQDWTRVTGMTPDIAQQIVRTHEAG